MAVLLAAVGLATHWPLLEQGGSAGLGAGQGAGCCAGRHVMRSWLASTAVPCEFRLAMRRYLHMGVGCVCEWVGGAGTEGPGGGCGTAALSWWVSGSAAKGLSWYARRWASCSCNSTALLVAGPLPEPLARQHSVPQPTQPQTDPSTQAAHHVSSLEEPLRLSRGRNSLW
jgi:hypothetical protein